MKTNKKKDGIIKNYLYNLSYQIIAMITPLLITPYVSRILRAEGVGKISYSSSIVTYFIILATVGVNEFGQRKIATEQNSPENRGNTFWELVLYRNIFVILSLILYGFFLSKIKSDIFIYYAQVLNILNVAFDISWFYRGMEDFKKIALINILSKIFCVVLVFWFIKKSEDYSLYILIFGITQIGGNALSWLFISDYINKANLKKIKIFRYQKTVFQFFIPQVCMQIYLVLDKTMIGIITKSDYENGCYEQSQKLVKMCLAIITAFGTVMASRIAALLQCENSKNIIKNSILYSYRFVFFIGMPLTFGIMGIAEHLVPWFFGPGYDKVVPLLSVFSFLILAIGMNNVSGGQYLLSVGRQNIFTISVIIGAIINLFMNMLLIPKYASLGAAVASVIAEGTIAMIQLGNMKEIVKIKEVLSLSVNYLAAAIFMYGGIKIVGCLVNINFIGTMIQIIMGGILYFSFLAICKDTMLQVITRRKMED